MHPHLSPMKKSILLITALASNAVLVAQSNQGGVVQLGLSLTGGAYSTEYEQTFFGLTVKETDGAASFSVPLEVNVGIMEPLSIGIYLQPGFYLDSSAERSNSFFIAGLTPRFYAVNKDRFNYWLGLEFGLSSLIIKENEGETNEIQYTFAGGHFRLATGINAYLTDRFGLQAGLKYAAYSMPLRDLEPDLPYYDATLKVSGIEFWLGLALRLGGS